MIKFNIKSINSINEVAAQFVKKIGSKKIFIFDGNMGVGKTTFIKAICETLGVKETISSPTFSIVNEYWTEENQIIYHFDCYRINKIEEAVAIGIEEYVYSGNLCFIEWAENIAPLLPDEAVRVKITEQVDGTRIVEMKI